jgi:outer membrane protein OmpA-like peptidoglycan-associated protein
MNRYLSLLFFFFLTFNPNLFSRDSYAIAVATQNTHYKYQRWTVNSDFPFDFVSELRQLSLFITSVQNHKDLWSLVFSNTSVIKNQDYFFSKTFPKSYISKKTKDGYMISHLCYDGSQWLIVMDSCSFQYKQEYFYSKKYPSSEIENGIKEGYYINKLQFSNGYWSLILNFDNNASQKIVKTKSLYDEIVLENFSNGYHITNITYHDSLYIIFTKNTYWGMQNAAVLDYTDINSTITKWQKKRFSITDLVIIQKPEIGISTILNQNYLKMYDFIKNTPESIDDSVFVNFIQKNPDSEVSFRALQKLAGMCIMNKNWDEAIKIYEKFKTRFPHKQNTINKIIDLLNTNTDSIVVENLGPNINSDFDDYYPVINLEGNKLYFCSYGRPYGYGGEDIYVSELNNNAWQKAINIGNEINSNSHEAILGISADNQLLAVFGNYQGSLGSGDIFFYKREKDRWGKRKHFSKPVNSIYFDSDLSFSSDGKVVFFVSDRPKKNRYLEKDNFANGLWGGDLDIYASVKTDSGWSEAINLGNQINTPFIDRSPFLHPDGKTLYFSSNGHYGLGALDVFKSERLNPDSWTEWSKPVNLGKEINTIENDWGYKISLDGKYAYFSALNQEDTTKKQDIFRILLPEETRPEVVATIKGKVIDPDGNFLSAKIKWEDLKTGAEVGELNSDSRDGSFFIALPIGRIYGYYAEKEGYYPASKNIDLTESMDSLLVLNEDIILMPIQDIKNKNISVRINNLFFDFNSAELKPESYFELKRLIKVLNENPGMKIELLGYTDNIGTDSFNKKLSLKRAKAVMNFLINNGINKNLIKPKGLGKINPVATNDTEKGRALNRRVEIKFVNK